MFLADITFVPDENGELISLATSVAEATPSLPPTDIAATLVKMLLAMAALALLLFASYWFLRKLVQNRMQKGGTHQSIQILEKRMISAKTMLYLVEVENKKVLLAESHLEIKTLAELPNAPEDSP